MQNTKVIDRGVPVRVLAVANQKGGVGKTTTTINLATAMAAVQKKVLIIDLDPQGNASTGLGLYSDARKINTYHLLIGEADLSDTILETNIPGLSVLPSGADLSGAEIELVEVENRLYRLKTALTGSVFSFDYILIDCPPSLSLLTVMALVSSHSLVVPLQTEFFALEGLTQLIKTIERIKVSLNPE